MKIIRKAATTVRNELINQANGYRHDAEVIQRAIRVRRIRQGRGK